MKESAFLSGKKKFSSEEKDLNNEEVVKAVLENGKSEELEKLRAFHNFTSEQIKLFCYYATLRRNTLEQMTQKIQDRKSKDTSATPEELDMGCYVENIEPQVRKAVLSLRRKGYNTYESGFFGFGRQKVSFQEEHLKNFEFPKEIVEKLKNKGIKISVRPNSVVLDFDSPLDISELEEVWNQIEYALPELPEPAKQCSLSAANSFREKQSNKT